MAPLIPPLLTLVLQSGGTVQQSEGCGCVDKGGGSLLMLDYVEDSG